MSVWLQDPDLTLYHGDALETLRQLPAGSVDMVATSPPFYGLRDYGTGTWDGGDPDCAHDPQAKHIYGCKGCGGHMNDNNPDCPHCADRHLKRSIHGTPERDIAERDPSRADLPNPPSGWAKRDATTRTLNPTCARCGARRVDRQIGLEETPDQWVDNLVQVFRECRRVLADHGTLWVEIGDSYGSGGGGGSPFENGRTDGRKSYESDNPGGRISGRAVIGHKPKDLLGQPWLLAFALRADGWYLRSEIIWARPNPMPESVTDRPTKSHSTIFLLSKQPRYYFDSDAIREPHTDTNGSRLAAQHRHGTTRTDDAVGAANPESPYDKQVKYRGLPGVGTTFGGFNPAGANARSVWTIPTEPTPYAHFATWPQKLVARMIQAGTSQHGKCPECGKPWKRQTEMERIREATPSGNREAGARGTFTATQVGGRRIVTTVDWAPSCRCIEQPDPSSFGGHPYTPRERAIGYGTPNDPRGCSPPTPVPCTVLDPFAGSGTTLLVARNHQRHSIGIELNADYCQIAAKRLQQLSLLT